MPYKILFTIIIFILSANFAQASEATSTGAMTASAVSNAPEKKPFNILNPLENLQIKIPGMEALSEKYPATCSNADGPTTCQLPFLAIYITAIYNYAMGIIGILAAVALMIGGMLWLVSAGNATRITQAKNWIGGAITGVIIMSTSYILLNEINPELIGLKAVKLEIVEDITAYEADDDPTAPLPPPISDTNTDCGLKFQSIAGIKSITYANVSMPALNPEAAEKFKQLALAAQKAGIKLTLTSAGRSVATQARLWNACLNSDKSDEGSPAKCRLIVAPPSCNGTHVRGQAIDLCISGKSCKHMGSKLASNAKYRDCDTKKLEDFMKANGWIRYCGEWWHFEYKDLGLPNRTGQGETCGGNPQPTNCP